MEKEFYIKKDSTMFLPSRDCVERMDDVRMYSYSPANKFHEMVVVKVSWDAPEKKIEITEEYFDEIYREAMEKSHSVKHFSLKDFFKQKLFHGGEK